MKYTSISTLSCFFGLVLSLHSQGYIVPNGVVQAGFDPASGYRINVIHDPTNSYSTGFFLKPTGLTQPTVYTNTFLFNPIIDVSVRVFLVSSNQPITQQSIQTGSYTELMSPPDYVFNHNSPFYVALYTGNMNFYPPGGVYSDPLFGWAKLRNFQGDIQLLDSALVYKAQGIYAGTQTMIPEPSSYALGVLGVVLFGIRRCKRFQT